MGKLTDYANQHLDEPPSEGFQWPKREWFAWQTPREGAAGFPELRVIPSGSHVLELRMTCVGGPEKHRYCVGRLGPRASIWPEERDNPQVPSGRLVGFLNSLFSPGVGDDLDPEARKKARWERTLQALDAVAERAGIDPADAPSLPIALAGIAIAAMKERQYLVLGTITTDRNGYDRLSSIIDYSPANIEKRQVTLYMDPAELGLDETLPF